MARPKKAAAPAYQKVDRDAEARSTIADIKKLRETYGGKYTDVEFKQMVEKLPLEKQQQFARVNRELLRRFQLAEARMDFEKFAKMMEPCLGHDLLPGKHFTTLAKSFMRIADGEELRQIVNIAPRRGKSVYCSQLFPAWFMGRFPGKKIIHVCNVKTLAADFGSKIRSLVESEEYRAVFPDIKLAKDAQAKDKFRIYPSGGEYFAVGTGGTITGRGADLLIVDDPHSETETTDGKLEPPTKEDFEKTANWFQTVLPRVHPGGSILVVMQRWGKADLTGRLIDSSRRSSGAHQWEVITMPALEEYEEDGQPKVRSTWPEFWPTEAIVKLRETLMGEPGGAWRWNAMYQQHPGADNAALFKREYWKRWPEGKKAPACEFVIQSWDIAATANDRSNYSACVTLGVFNTSEREDKPVYNLIVLDAERGKWNFPELKLTVMRKYNSVVKDGHPDCLIIEHKSSGIALVQELRKTGVPVTTTSPSGNQYAGGNDKFARGQRVLEILSSGLVHIPSRAWAEMLIEECAEFPNGDYDDLYDAFIQALGRFRDGGFISLATDEVEEPEEPRLMMPLYNLG